MHFRLMIVLLFTMVSAMVCTAKEVECNGLSVKMAVHCVCQEAHSRARTICAAASGTVGENVLCEPEMRRMHISLVENCASTLKGVEGLAARALIRPSLHKVNRGYYARPSNVVRLYAPYPSSVVRKVVVGQDEKERMVRRLVSYNNLDRRA